MAKHEQKSEEQNLRAQLAQLLAENAKLKAAKAESSIKAEAGRFKNAKGEIIETRGVRIGRKFVSNAVLQTVLDNPDLVAAEMVEAESMELADWTKRKAS